MFSSPRVAVSYRESHNQIVKSGEEKGFDQRTYAGCGLRKACAVSLDPSLTGMYAHIKRYAWKFTQTAERQGNCSSFCRSYCATLTLLSMKQASIPHCLSPCV